MAIAWGGFVSHMRVGIDIRTAGNNPMDLYIDVWVQCEGNYNFADNQHVSLRGSASGDWDFYNNLGANQTRLIGTVVIRGQYRSYGGGPTYNFSSDLTGNYLGGVSSASRSYTLPALPAGVPDPPSSPPNWTNVTTESATLTWGATTDAHGSAPIEDELQASRNNGFTDLIHDSIQPGNSRVVTGFAPNTSYWFRSRIRNSIGWSGWSAVSNGITPPFNTAAPSVTDQGPDAATVNWLPPSGGTATRYEVQWARDTTFSNPGSVSGATWATSRRLTGLAPGTTYYTRVRSGTATGWGTWSSATQFATTAFATTAPVVTDIGPDNALVSWTAPGGATATGYDLQWARDAAFTNSVVTSSSDTWGTSRRITGLLTATRYYVRVRSKTANGVGSWSPGTAFDTVSGAKVKVAGVWKDAPAFVKVAGVWKAVKVNKKSNGQWVS